MPIRINYFLGTKSTETGEVKLFGKIGYQTMNPQLDRFTQKNLSDIERALLAGELTDLDGNVVSDNAVIDVYAQVSVVTPTTELETVGTIRNSAGTVAKVPASAGKSAPAGDSDIPF